MFNTVFNGLLGIKCIQYQKLHMLVSTSVRRGEDLVVLDNQTHQKGRDLHKFIVSVSTAKYLEPIFYIRISWLHVWSVFFRTKIFILLTLLE